MRKLLILSILLNSSFILFAQKEALKTKIDSIKGLEKKPEIFNSGFIDVINNGQVNASARLIRLYIGEQGKFSIPLSFYGGVSSSFSNNF